MIYKSSRTPGRRNQILPDYKICKKTNKSSYIKDLREKFKVARKEYAGRNHTGAISIRRRGGGVKQMNQVVCRNRNLQKSYIPYELTGKVYSIDYSAKVKSYVAQQVYPYDRSWKNVSELEGVRIIDENYFCFYIICPKGLSVGDTIALNPESYTTSVGTTMEVGQFRQGDQVHAQEQQALKGEKQIRSPGSSGFIVEFFTNPKGCPKGNYTLIRQPSNEERQIPQNAVASAGVVGNENYRLINCGKAGRNRQLSKRPKVRGVAMNPVDHPHGGGEGKSSGGRPSVTPWGRPTRNFHLRKRPTNKLVFKSRSSAKAKRRKK